MFSHENLQQFPIRNSAVLSLSAFSFGHHPCRLRLTEAAWVLPTRLPNVAGIRPDYIHVH